jgi:hypothetical protein
MKAGRAELTWVAWSWTSKQKSVGRKLQKSFKNVLYTHLSIEQNHDRRCTTISLRCD